MKTKIVLSMLLVAFLIPQIAMAGTVTRTIEGNNYIRIGETDQSITVKLTGDPEETFSFWGGVETFPENINVAVLTPHANVEKDDSTHYSFADINGMELKYTLTISPTNENVAVGTYPLSGIFVDEDKNTGDITPGDMNIYILPLCNDDPICRYDTNNSGLIEKTEAINAVSDYFDETQLLSLVDVLKVVRAYLGL